MSKDTVVASALGFGLGLVAAIALWVVPRILPQQSTQPEPTEQAVVETEDPEVKEKAFSIITPQEGEILSQDSVMIEGLSPDDQVVLAATHLDSAVAKPDEDGNFSMELDLEEGGNEILIHNLSSPETTQTIWVFYYEEEI